MARTMRARISSGSPARSSIAIAPKSASFPASGRVLPMNATGAIGALACELRFPPRIVRGFGVLARAIGLVGHIMEEWEQPMALEIWQRVDEEASEAARKKGGA